MDHILLIALLGLSAISLGSKLFFLSKTPLGIWVIASNVFYETLEKKGSLSRWQIDGVLFVALPILWYISTNVWAGYLFLFFFGAAWIYALQVDMRYRTNDPGRQEERFGAEEVPLPNPRLIMNIHGPFLERGVQLELGDWPEGYSAHFEIIVLNPTILWPQFPMKLQISSQSNKISLERHFEEVQKTPEPGEYISTTFILEAKQLSDEPIDIIVTASTGSYQLQEKIRLNSIFSLVNQKVLDRFLTSAGATV